jgi:transcriptional regulator with XRE-family HTH domain
MFGTRAGGPTVQRLVLGGQLHRLRESRGISAEQAAEAIRGSHSKISRMEHGRVGFKERDVSDLLTLYGVTDSEERAALLNLAREANTPGWWHAYSDVLPTWLEPYVGLEAAASVLRTYEVQFVPGLLQTEEYARALIRLGQAVSEDEVDRRAELRVSRQEILGGPNPPQLWAVVDEGALRRPVGGPEVAHRQLQHLIKMAEHPAVTLQILPFTAGPHSAMGGPFTILRFAEPDLRDVVYIEQLTSALYLDKPSEVDSYLEVMEQLCLQAEPAATRSRSSARSSPRPPDPRYDRPHLFPCRVPSVPPGAGISECDSLTVLAGRVPLSLVSGRGRTVTDGADGEDEAPGADPRGRWRSACVQHLEGFGQVAFGQAARGRRAREKAPDPLLQVGQVADLALVRAQRGDLLAERAGHVHEMAG